MIKGKQDPIPYVRVGPSLCWKNENYGEKRRTESLKRRLWKILQKFCELPKKNTSSAPDVTKTATHLDCQGKTEVNNF